MKRFDTREELLLETAIIDDTEVVDQNPLTRRVVMGLFLSSLKSGQGKYELHSFR